MDALRSILTRLQQQGTALGHFNVADLVLLKAVVAAAVEVRVPVIVGASEGERDFLGTYELAALVKASARTVTSQFSLTQIIRIHWRKQWRRRGRGSKGGTSATPMRMARKVDPQTK